MKKFLIFLAREFLHLVIIILICLSYIVSPLIVGYYVELLTGLCGKTVTEIIYGIGIGKMLIATHSKYVYEFINLFWKEDNDTTL